jgi:HD-GYP domain-containing protein (c-di-GMP phosphodiesterase class II)
MSADDFGRETALRLRMACEAYDPDIKSHLEDVTRYTLGLGRQVGLAAAHLERIALAAPLHDLGKIGVPLSIFRKSGPLTPAERQQVEAHTVIGHRLLDGSSSPPLRCAADMALSHHEWWNGEGYPHRLKGPGIPFDARLVAIGDVFDALVSQRAYKEAWDLDRVIEEMRRQRGLQFDPDLLDLFLGHLPVESAA